jgi:hypothetical protein
MRCTPAWIDRLERKLTALVRDRGAIAPERSIDVPFDDFMAGEHGVAERVYGLVGTSDRRRPYRDERVPGRPPARPTRPRGDDVRMFGPNDDELCEGFSPYVSLLL